MNDNKPLPPGVVLRPARTGMGVGIVIPSLLRWKPSELPQPTVAKPAAKARRLR